MHAFAIVTYVPSWLVVRAALHRRRLVCVQLMNFSSLITSIFREFTLAEIEHFVDPSDKSHPKFEDVGNVQVTMLPGSYQMSGKPALNITLKEAYDTVSKRLLNDTSLCLADFHNGCLLWHVLVQLFYVNLFTSMSSLSI